MNHPTTARQTPGNPTQTPFGGDAPSTGDTARIDPSRQPENTAQAHQVESGKTNFFSQLNRYLEYLDVTMSVRKVGEGQIAVSVLPKAKVDDRVKDTIAPMVLTATPAALDAEFFSYLRKPLAQSEEFFGDLSAFEASLKKAEQNSQKAKKLKEEEDKKKKKADIHLARANELMEAKKYAEAVIEAEKAVKEVPGYEKAEKRLKELREETNIHQQVDLFAATTPPPTPTSEGPPTVAPDESDARPAVSTGAVSTGGASSPVGQPVVPQDSLAAGVTSPLKTSKSYFK